MKKVNADNCTVNTRVTLAFPDPCYKNGIVKISMKVLDGGIAVGVLWENGRFNFYSEDELVLAEDVGFISIWD